MSDNAALHASAISYHGAGCLILGASGTGKSRIVADALMHGARLVADDRVKLVVMEGFLAAAQVPELAGVLELRGLGLVKIHNTLARQILHLVVELVDAPLPEFERLPERITREYHGIALPYIRLPAAPHTTATQVLTYLSALHEGRVLPTDFRP